MLALITRYVKSAILRFSEKCFLLAPFAVLFSSHKKLLVSLHKKFCARLVCILIH